MVTNPFEPKIKVLEIQRDKSADLITRPMNENKVTVHEKQNLNVTFDTEDVFYVKLPLINFPPNRKRMVIHRAGKRRVERMNTKGEDKFLGPLTQKENAGLIKTLMAESLAKVKAMKDWQIAVIIVLLIIAIAIGLAGLAGVHIGTTPIVQNVTTTVPPTYGISP